MSHFICRRLASSALGGIALLAVSILTGCERKERVLEIETPDREVRVDRNIDTGRIDVEIDR
jgi:hypothetical protein